MEYLVDGKHKGFGNYGFAGTPCYGSISGLEGNTLSRRDDLETLGYTLLYLKDPKSMPWLDFCDPTGNSPTP